MILVSEKAPLLFLSPAKKSSTNYFLQLVENYTNDRSSWLLRRSGGNFWNKQSNSCSIFCYSYWVGIEGIITAGLWRACPLRSECLFCDRQAKHKKQCGFIFWKRLYAVARGSFLEVDIWMYEWWNIPDFAKTYHYISCLGRIALKRPWKILICTHVITKHSESNILLLQTTSPCSRARYSST